MWRSVPVIWQNCLSVESVQVIWQNSLLVDECASDLAELLVLLASAGQGPHPRPRDLLASAGQGPPRPWDLLASVGHCCQYYY